MPRDGSGIYSIPLGTDAVSDQTIESTKYNNAVHDLEQDLNLPRPVVAGGTGASDAATARGNLNAAVGTQTVTNYDAQVWENGFFASAPGATAAPTAVGLYSGNAYVITGDRNYITLEAMSNATGITYIRQKIAGLWSAWVRADQAAADGVSSKVAKAGDTMGGSLSLNYANPVLSLVKNVIGNNCDITAYFNANPAWLVRLAGGATSDFALYRFNDAAVLIDAPISIARSDGKVVLNGDPAAALHAATKQYVDARDTLNVAKAGDTMSGALTVNALTTSKGLSSSEDIRVWRSSLLAGGAVRFGNASATSYLQYDGAAFTFSGGAVNLTGLLAGQAPFGTAGGNVINVGYAGGASQYGMLMRAGVDPSNAVIFHNAAAGIVGGIATTSVATAFNTSSDMRLKEGVEAFDAGQIIDDTEVFSFKWKSTGGRSYGVSAQQAAEVFPQAVTYVAEQDWYGIDYSKYVPVLLQELKALRARVAQLEAGMASKPA